MSTKKRFSLLIPVLAFSTLGACAQKGEHQTHLSRDEKRSEDTSSAEHKASVDIAVWNGQNLLDPEATPSLGRLSIDANSDAVTYVKNPQDGWGRSLIERNIETNINGVRYTAHTLELEQSFLSEREAAEFFDIEAEKIANRLNSRNPSSDLDSTAIWDTNSKPSNNLARLVININRNGKRVTARHTLIA